MLFRTKRESPSLINSWVNIAFENYQHGLKGIEALDEVMLSINRARLKEMPLSTSIFSLSIPTKQAIINWRNKFASADVAANIGKDRRSYIFDIRHSAYH